MVKTIRSIVAPNIADVYHADSPIAFNSPSWNINLFTSAFEMLMRADLKNWSTLVVGLEHDWCEKTNIIEFAERCASEAEQVDGALLTIVTGDYLSNNELVLSCLRYMETIGEPLTPENRQLALDQWRLSCLLLLLDGPDTDEEKINKLQEIYAVFGFPEDMASCSIYSKNGSDPLTAAHTVVQQLSGKLTYKNE